MPKYYSYVVAPQPPAPKQTQTSTPLGSNGVWSSVIFSTEDFNTLTGSVFSNQPGTLLIEQSNDQVNWDIQSEYSVPASDGKGFKEDLLLPFVRVKYTNGGTAQTTFRLNFNLK